MSDIPDNLVLARLREIRDMLARVLEDTAAIKMSLDRTNRSIEADTDDE